MNIRQAKEEIRHTVRAYLAKDAAGEYRIPAIRQRPLLLMGPPGIGKTQIMEQVARECRIGLVAYTITHHTRQSAVGLPFIREETFDGKTYSVTEYTMSEIIASVYRSIRDTGMQEGILFIDEINCVSETLAPTMLQFLQCKTFGGQAVPKGWLIVAAGNPPEYNRSVRDFDMVTLDRVRYLHVEADYSVWREYARAQHIHGAILSYLELRQRNFYRVETDVDGMQFVTARGWEDFSNLMELYEEQGILVDEEIVYEFLQHREVAEDAAAYFALYRKYQDDYGIPEILAGRVKPQVYARIYAAAFDERLSVVHLLLSGLGKKFGDVARERELTDAWYAFLKEYQNRLKEAEDAGETPDAQAIYGELVEAQEDGLALKKKSGLLGRGEESAGKLLIRELKKWRPSVSRPGQPERPVKSQPGKPEETVEAQPGQSNMLMELQSEQPEKPSVSRPGQSEKHAEEKTNEGESSGWAENHAMFRETEEMTAGTTSGQESGSAESVRAREFFAAAKQGFDEQREKLERAEEAAAQALEYAFDFMEQACSDGQEMVVFVTELALNSEAALFLSEHTSERYVSYSERLLIGTRRAELLSELERGMM